MFKEKINKFFNNIILPFSGIFTALTLLLGLCSYSVNKIPAIPVNNLLILALFSLILSFLNRLFYLKKLSVYIKMAIHFIFTTLSLYLILFIFTKNIIDSTANLRTVLVLLYVIIYIIIAVIYTCVRETKRFRKPKEKKKQTADEYHSIYGDK